MSPVSYVPSVWLRMCIQGLGPTLRSSVTWHLDIVTACEERRKGEQRVQLHLYTRCTNYAISFIFTISSGFLRPCPRFTRGLPLCFTLHTLALRSVNFTIPWRHSPNFSVSVFQSPLRSVAIFFASLFDGSPGCRFPAQQRFLSTASRRTPVSLLCNGYRIYDRESSA